MGAEIEWNKLYARNALATIAPEANPKFFIASSPREINSIIREFGNDPVVVKPVGLTGGKGVKVVGKNLRSNYEAEKYAGEVLSRSIGGNSGAVIIEEVISGFEFTIQCLTDGRQVVFSPATYDYPYRLEGDKGPGTGGMGSYSLSSKYLPFLSYELYSEACDIAQRFINHIREDKNFNGVLNPGFFVTKTGDIKVIEFNSRFGDPECMNIMSLLTSDVLPIFEAIEASRLTQDLVTFKQSDSLVVYLVSPDYAIRNGAKYQFNLEPNAIRENGVDVHFSSSIQLAEGLYETVGNSRCVALSTSGGELEELRKRIFISLDRYYSGPLQWRKDIASKEHLEMMKGLI